MSSNSKKTFKPNTGYLVLLIFFVIFFMGMAAVCVHFSLEFDDGIFYFIAGICVLAAVIMLFVFFQNNNVFAISNEGFLLKETLYPWKQVILGGVRRETVKHTVMFVPVAKTSSEHFYIVLVPENYPVAKMKKLKVFSRAYSDYNEIRALVTKYTKKNKN
jgi:glucan phosphoethanolaminetransferase (alkaline phosphatase superfamily)